MQEHDRLSPEDRKMLAESARKRELENVKGETLEAMARLSKEQVTDKLVLVTEQIEKLGAQKAAIEEHLKTL